MAFVPFFLSSCGSLVCALTPFFVPATSSFWALQYPISRRLPKPPSLCTHPICTPQSHSHDTHTYYTVYTTHASILFCNHTFFSSCCISLVLSLVPSRFVLHSLFPVCSDRFALILFVFCFPSIALVLSLLPLCSCFGH